MTLIQIIAGLSITLFWTLCATLNKKAVLNGNNPYDIAISNAVWMFASVITITFFFWEKEFVPFLNQGYGAIFPAAVSLSKGISIYILTIAFSEISRHSMSSGVFALTSGLPIGSLIIMYFLKENLSLWDIVSVVLIGGISFLFFLKGHARFLTKKDKLIYLLLIGSVTFNMIADRITGVDQSWAVHLVLSNISWLIISLIQRQRAEKTKKIKRRSILQKNMMLMSAFYLLTEITFIYAAQNIFHAVIPAFIFLRIATPIIMLIGAVKFDEGKWYRQLAFGICVIVPAIMSIVL